MARREPSWLKKAVFYQIYPSSFYDNNGDGIGDLPGIISKLDYLKTLGINAIWLNPCFKSPFFDGGYDITDYRQVDPRFGTNEDLERLFAEAAAREIKVCLDLVPGHTSVEHPWFKASSFAEPNKYSNYFIWTDDWLANHGNFPVISGKSNRNGSYVINFFAIQPALNYGFSKPDKNCPWQLPVNHPDVLKVREEIKEIMRFWLARGASGFRVDMAGSLIKNDPDARENRKFWKEIRAEFDREYPDAVLISEWGYPQHSLRGGFHCDFLTHCHTPALTTLFRNEPERDIFKAFVKGGWEYTPEHAIKNFNSYFDASGKGDVRNFFKYYLEAYNTTQHFGYISIPSGNHDMPRLCDNRSDAVMTTAFAFLLTMPGVPFIYYGDEIGMRNVKDLVSKEGGYNRTQARTPMQWDESVNAGFSTAPPEKIYLPIDPDEKRPTVNKSITDPMSLWHRVKELLKLRYDSPALEADAKLEVLLQDYPLIFLRRKGINCCLVLIQPAARQWQGKIKLSKYAKFGRILWQFGEVNTIEKNGVLIFNGNGAAAAVWQMC